MPAQLNLCLRRQASSLLSSTSIDKTVTWEPPPGRITGIPGPAPTPTASPPPTATATTRVHAYRPHPGGEPVVLLSGAGYNASYWYLHAAALAADGPVFGIDMPGDPSPSIWRARSLRRSPARPGWTSCSASSATGRRTW